MTTRLRIHCLSLCVLAFSLSGCVSTQADGPFDNTGELFKKAGQSADFFNTAYGYAVFPTIGHGGVVISGARGVGRVYAQGRHTGNVTMTQITGGFILGGRGYSQIVFFEDEAAYNDFTDGNFEFGAQVAAVAITAAASASAATTGTSASASGTKDDAAAVASYRRGIAVFTIARGGLLYEASVGGQKFSYRPI